MRGSYFRHRTVGKALGPLAVAERDIFAHFVRSIEPAQRLKWTPPGLALSSARPEPQPHRATTLPSRFPRSRWSLGRPSRMAQPLAGARELSQRATARGPTAPWWTERANLAGVEEESLRRHYPSRARISASATASEVRAFTDGSVAELSTMARSHSQPGEGFRDYRATQKREIEGADPIAETITASLRSSRVGRPVPRLRRRGLRAGRRRPRRGSRPPGGAA